MARIYVTVGYVHENETRLGVWTSVPTEKKYFGDILANRRSWSKGEGSTNPNYNVSNNISIVADKYMLSNYSIIRYVKIDGASWEVQNIDISQRPRLILSIGGLYNGDRIRPDQTGEAP